MEVFRVLGLRRSPAATRRRLRPAAGGGSSSPSGPFAATRAGLPCACTVSRCSAIDLFVSFGDRRGRRPQLEPSPDNPIGWLLLIVGGGHRSAPPSRPPIVGLRSPTHGGAAAGVDGAGRAARSRGALPAAGVPPLCSSPTVGPFASLAVVRVGGRRISCPVLSIEFALPSLRWTSTTGLRRCANPLHVAALGVDRSALGSWLAVLLALFVLGGRCRWSSGSAGRRGDERQQLRWFVFAAVVSRSTSWSRAILDVVGISGGDVGRRSRPVSRFARHPGRRRHRDPPVPPVGPRRRRPQRRWCPRSRGLALVVYAGVVRADHVRPRSREHAVLRGRPRRSDRVPARPAGRPPVRGPARVRRRATPYEVLAEFSDRMGTLLPPTTCSRAWPMSSGRAWGRSAPVCGFGSARAPAGGCLARRRLVRPTPRPPSRRTLDDPRRAGGPRSRRAARRAVRAHARRRPDGPGEGDVRTRPRGAGGPRPAERPPRRGAPDLAAAARRGPGRGASPARAQHPRRRAAAARGARREGSPRGS